MPFTRDQPPRRDEILVDFAKRTFTYLIGKLLKQTTDLHVVADRYDGLFKDIEGCEIVSLKGSSGFHEQRGNRLGKSFSIQLNMVLDSWDSILLDIRSKAKLIECMFDRY
jgi:hypothetical protein